MLVQMGSGKTGLYWRTRQVHRYPPFKALLKALLRGEEVMKSRWAWLVGVPLLMPVAALAQSDPLRLGLLTVKTGPLAERRH